MNICAYFMDDGFVYIGNTSTVEGKLMNFCVTPTRKLIKNKNYEERIIKLYNKNKKYTREMPLNLNKIIGSYKIYSKNN
jgi:hypothetical protein